MRRKASHDLCWAHPSSLLMLGPYFKAGLAGGNYLVVVALWAQVSCLRKTAIVSFHALLSLLWVTSVGRRLIDILLLWLPVRRFEFTNSLIWRISCFTPVPIPSDSPSFLASCNVRLKINRRPHFRDAPDFPFVVWECIRFFSRRWNNLVLDASFEVLDIILAFRSQLRICLDLWKIWGCNSLVLNFLPETKHPVELWSDFSCCLLSRVYLNLNLLELGKLILERLQMAIDTLVLAIEIERKEATAILLPLTSRSSIALIFIFRGSYSSRRGDASSGCYSATRSTRALNAFLVSPRALDISIYFIFRVTSPRHKLARLVCILSVAKIVSLVWWTVPNESYFRVALDSRSAGYHTNLVE